MDWPILDFLFNLITLSGLIAVLTIIWIIIISMIGMFLEEIGGRK
ncbi:hypothetical protein [Streptococcus suis]|uniref:Uncharacterized protein n=1 Tax=Streptococcus suis TaxID=1307 RepID=A0AB37G0U9_STRSU|nr:hypothetical protein [Streptococcus suis]MDW8659074.1 hypothetical protein [Streptococcus suis]MDW8685321.1 hypothetical protein [Streptococcus suis]MDW8733670.1 hypothetical protein [Streptococcus suis]MDY7304004.1 hypothetical protein [Streptococcus suis]QOE28617.1 hypothetical protein SSU1300283_01300 [Streptococcus suis]